MGMALGGITNILAPSSVVEDYVRWGYPTWFHYITGALELTTAALLVLRGTRKAGAVLGGAVMGSAIITLLMNNEVAHAAIPAVVLALLTLAFFRLSAPDA